MLIATRTLKIHRQAENLDVPIRIFAPQHDNSLGWGCRFEIEWPDGATTMTARGIDAVQALEIAMKLIGVQLYTSRYHEAGELAFGKPGAGFGFPVPQNMRDVLVGEDAKYF
jgi:hypothetical protein